MNEIEKAIELAIAEYKKEQGEDAKLEDGESFVTIFNNCVLIIGLDGTTMRTEFIGGKPFKVDMTLKIYKNIYGEE